MSAWSHQGCLQWSSSSEGNIHCTKPVIIKTVDVKIVNLHLIVSYNYFGSHLIWEETYCFPELCTILQSHQQCMIVQFLNIFTYSFFFFPSFLLYLFLVGMKNGISLCCCFCYMFYFFVQSAISEIHTFFFSQVKHALVLEFITKNCSLWLPVPSTLLS